MSDEKEREEETGCDHCATCPGCGEPEGDAPEKPATDADAEPEQEEDK